MKTMKTAEEKRAHRNRLQREKRANRTPEQREKDNAYKRAWSAKKKQREDEALRRFQHNNDIDEVREIMAKREKNRAYQAKFHAANPDYQKNYYKANKKKMNSQMKGWRDENPDYHKNWNKENPDYNKNHSAKFREENPDYRQNYLENLDLTDETTDNQTRLLAWGAQVRLRDGNRCYYHSSECSSWIDAHHIIPKEWKSKSSLHNFAAMKFSLDNGMCLCRKHHIAVHKEMKLWMRE